MSGITPTATAFTESYARAVALGAEGTPTALEACATAMTSHYVPQLVAFTLGQTHTIPSTDAATTGTLTHLRKLAKSGVGCDIAMVRHAVKEVGPGSAVVFVTWELRSKKKGVENWRWRNAYGFRKGPGMEEGKWEFIVSDDEIGELLKRVPNYFEL